MCSASVFGIEFRTPSLRVGCVAKLGFKLRLAQKQKQIRFVIHGAHFHIHTTTENRPGANKLDHCTLFFAFLPFTRSSSLSLSLSLSFVFKAEHCYPRWLVHRSSLSGLSPSGYPAGGKNFSSAFPRCQRGRKELSHRKYQRAAYQHQRVRELHL